MAVSSWGVNAPEAVKLWSRKTFHEVLKRTWMSKFMGADSNSLIQTVEGPNKGPGDQVRVTLRMLLTGAGIQGDSTLEGNEEALVTYTDDVIIDQLRHAVRSAGKMTEQRVPFSVREEARMGLVDWWSDRIDTWCFNQLAGVAGPQTAGAATSADTRYTGNNARVAPTRTLFASGNFDSINTSVSASGLSFKLSLLDRAVVIAKTATPQIRPVRVGGSDHYVCFLHPNQVRDLRTNTDTGQWYDIQRAAMEGGNVKDNPIFSGALGVYNGVILHESTRVPRVEDASQTAASHARSALFCGAQAGLMAYGQGYGKSKMSWTEELFDYGNQLGVSAGLISGVTKAQFNSSDFATMLIQTQAVDES